jgi:2-haloacid dehalogenase
MNRRGWFGCAIGSVGLAALSWRVYSHGGTKVEVLLFDLFGTLVEWRSSLTRYCEHFGRERKLTADWEKFVVQWQASYLPALDEVRSSRRPFISLDVLRREILDRLLPSFGLGTLTEIERSTLVQGWSHLETWPDTVSALTRLKGRYYLTTLSNGGLGFQQKLVAHTGMPVDRVLSADHFQHFKPDSAVYVGAAEMVARPPAALMLVAAHNNDLTAARACGWKTAYVQRATEDAGPDSDWDIIAQDMHDLSRQLGT